MLYSVFGLSWAIPHGFGPLFAGYVMDNYDPNSFWYMMGAMAIVAALGFVCLHQATHITSEEKTKHTPLSSESVVNELNF